MKESERRLAESRIVVHGEGASRDDLQIPREAELVPDELPILPLRGVGVSPHTSVPLTIGQPRSIKLVDDVAAGDRLIGLVASRDPELELPGPAELYEYGTVAAIQRLFRVPDGTIRLIAQGHARLKGGAFTANHPYLRAHIEPLPEVIERGGEVEAPIGAALDQFQKVADLSP